MNDFPQAYHLTFGTYGTRLHGDERGTVQRSMNKPGDPILGKCEQWEQMETRLLKFPRVLLSLDQRLTTQEAIPAICSRGGWTFVACAARGDHVHTVLRATSDGKAVRRWLKRWVGEILSSRWPMVAGATWWAECGSNKWVWTDDYLQNVYDYVEQQRTMNENG